MKKLSLYFCLLLCFILDTLEVDSEWNSVQLRNQFEDESLPIPQGVPEENRHCVFPYGPWTHKDTFLSTHPSGYLYGAGRIRNTRVDYSHYDHLQQSVQIIAVPECGYEVWGAVWYINSEDWATKKQEDVDLNAYVSILAEIEMISGETVTCYTFYPIIVPKKLAYGEGIPTYRQPASYYRDRIVQGLSEIGAPESYINGIANTPAIPKKSPLGMGANKNKKSSNKRKRLKKANIKRQLNGE